MTDFRMPSLGADMEAGTLVEWFVHPGARVARGDVVAVVETAKGAIDIEIFVSGVISELVVPPGTKVPVGAVLARVEEGLSASQPPAIATIALNPGAAATVGPVAAPTAPIPLVASPLAPPADASHRTASPPAADTGRLRATPAARREAERRRLSLVGIRGSGVDGAIALADLPASTASSPRRAGFDAKAMRGAIAAAMGRSKREIPHYYLSQTIDIAPALAHLERLNAGRAPPDRILPAAIMLRAAALAIAAMPEINGFWEEGAFRSGDGVHIGWAVSLRGGGLVAPAIRDADKLQLAALMAALKDVVARARSGGLRSSELTDPTITITSLGERGAESVLPIIYPPQVAVLGFGRVVERPWVVEGAIVPRRVVAMTLAGDHRATDGHRGSLLLARIESLLQTPEAL